MNIWKKYKFLKKTNKVRQNSILSPYVRQKMVESYTKNICYTILCIFSIQSLRIIDKNSAHKNSNTKIQQKFFKIIKNFENNSDFYQNTDKNAYIFPTKLRNPSKSPTKIMVFAGWRTGSTFTSELFNRHPDVFYQFEPLFPLRKGNKYMDHRGAGGELLKNSSSSLTHANTILENLYNNCTLTKASTYGGKKVCGTPNGICFRFKNALFLRPPFCTDREDLFYKYPSNFKEGTFFSDFV